MTVSVEAAQRVHKMISTPKGRASPKPSIKHDDGNMEEMQGRLSPVGSEKSTTSQTISNKERRLALEKDVDELKKRLRYEEDVHRALERAFSRPLGTLPRLPPYLPAQTIELVAEVAVLEEEVVRLEEQVVIFRQDLYKEAVYISSSKSRLTAASSNLTTCPRTPKNLDPEPEKPTSTPSRNHMNVNNKPGKPKSTPSRNRQLQSLSDGKGKSDGCSSPKPANKKVNQKVNRSIEKASEPRKLQFERRLKGLKDPADSSNSPASREKLPFNDNPDGNPGDIEHGNSYPSPLRKNVYRITEKVPETLKLQAERRLKSQENKNAAESRHSPATPERTPTRIPNRFMEEVGDGITCPSPMKKKVPGTTVKASGTRKVQLERMVKSQENKDAVESRHSPASGGKISPEDSPNGISEEMECGIVCPSPIRKKVIDVTEKASEARRLQLECRVKCQENAAESCSQSSGERTPLVNSPEETSEETGDEIPCPSPIIKKVHDKTEKVSDTRKLQLERRVKCKDNAAESIYSTLSEEKTPYDDNPNRVSEDILKCLSSILMRKCGLKNHRPSEQLPFLSPLLFSNRNEGMGCRDPYDICSEYGERDIGPYKDLPSIDARSIKSNRTGHYVFLEERLKVLHRKLAKINLRNLTHQEKLAFWINIYNSCVMNGYLEYGIPENPQTVVALMHKAKINVAGHLLNPMTIEHFILRLPYHSIYNFQKGMMNNEMTVRSMFGLELSEPLVTFALSCGSWSSPAVRVYTASQVEDELEAAKRDYLQASVGISPTKFGIPKLLDWYLLDFAKDLDSLLDWICLQLPSDLGKEAIKSLEKAKNKPLSEIVQVLPYDFSFRYLLCT